MKPCKAFGTVLANSKHLKIIATIVVLLAPKWAFSRIPGFDFSVLSFQVVKYVGPVEGCKESCILLKCQPLLRGKSRTA